MNFVKPSSSGGHGAISASSPALFFGLLLLCGFFWQPAIAAAAVLRVPDDYATIQVAVAAAVSGDLIELADGTYSGSGNHDVVVRKSLTIKSAGGDCEACVIDCRHEGRALLLSRTGTTEVKLILSGLTLKNGSVGVGADGGALKCEAGTRLVIENCCLTHNQAGGRGGALFAAGVVEGRGSGFRDNDSDGPGGAVYLLSLSAFEHCEFSGNRSGQDAGGAVACSGRGSDFSSCIFTQNLAVTSGGALWAATLIAYPPVFRSCRFESNKNLCGEGGAVSLQDVSGETCFDQCVFNDNNSNGGGGAVGLKRATARFTGCNFLNNSGQVGGALLAAPAELALKTCRFTDNGAFNGGALACGSSGASRLERCFFRGNEAAFDGGALHFYKLSGLDQLNTPTIVRCSFRGNETTGGGVINSSGGAIHASFANLTVVNSIFVYNRAGTDGGALYFSQDAGGTLTNCTLSLNEAEESGGALWCSIPLRRPLARIRLRNTILWKDKAPEGAEIEEQGIPLEIDYSLIVGGHAGSGNLDGDPGFIAPGQSLLADFRLQPGSICIDSGTGDGAPEDDFDGLARPRFCGTDIGAYEFFDMHLWAGANPPTWDNPESWDTGRIPDFTCCTWIVSRPTFPTCSVVFSGARSGLVVISGGTLAISNEGCLTIFDPGCEDR